MTGRAVVVILLLAPLLAAPAAASPGPVVERLVSFHGDAPPAGSRLPGGAEVVEVFRFAGVARLVGPEEALERLARLPEVAGVYADEPLRFQLDRSRAVVRADPPAREAGWPTGEGVTIAVVDSGIDEAHPAFDGRILASVRLARSGAVVQAGGDDDGHGTHIAGILAGSGAGSRAERLRGVAPRAGLVAVDISDAFTTTSAVRAFQWIHDHRDEYGIRVVSNSWGREKDDAHYDAHDPVIRASDALVADGLVVVFSAGNRGRDGAATLTTEATNPNVLTVGAAAASGRVEPYSSRGPATDAQGSSLAWTKPDLVAPGTGIVSTRSGALAHPSPRSDEERHYVTMNGTSMAAPHVAAAAALLLDLEPELSPALVMAILQATAQDVASPGADAETGYGMLDVRAAVEAARSLEARTVTIETHVPVHASGTVAAVAGRILLEEEDARLPPREQVVVPVVAPPGAARMELWFNWTGTGALDVRLEGEDGTRRFVPVAPGRLKLEAEAREGAYRLVVSPLGAAAHGSWSLAGAVVVLETRTLEAPAEFTTRATPLAAGFFLPQGSADALVSVPVGWRAMALASGVGTILGVAAVARRRA